MPARRPGSAGCSPTIWKRAWPASPVAWRGPTSFDPRATGLGLLGRLGLVFMFGGTPPRNGAVGAGAQIHIDVVEEAHHVRVFGERRHHLAVGGVDVLAAVGRDFVEVDVAERLQ